jgi:hypothetical protein
MMVIMSWRFLLICAFVVVVLYGAGSIVASSGSPERSPAHRATTPTSGTQVIQEELGSVDGSEAKWTPRPATSADLEGCSTPVDGRQTCVRLTTP